MSSVPRPAAVPYRPVYCLLGLPFDVLSWPAVIEQLEAALDAEPSQEDDDRVPPPSGPGPARDAIVVLAGLAAVLQARRQREWRETVLTSRLSLPASAPLTWLGRLLGVPFPAPVAPQRLLRYPDSRLGSAWAARLAAGLQQGPRRSGFPWQTPFALLRLLASRLPVLLFCRLVYCRRAVAPLVTEVMGPMPTHPYRLALDDVPAKVVLHGGWHDDDAPRLHGMLEGLAQLAGPGGTVTLYLGAVTWLGAAAIGQLLAWHGRLLRQDSELLLVQPSPAVRRLLYAHGAEFLL